MNKKTLFILSLLFLIVLILASCKNKTEVSLQEKQDCYKKCMLVEDDKEYCLDDCDMKESELEAQAVCGDGVCAAFENQTALCPADCGGCATNAECGEKEICKDAVCKPVDCLQESDCPDGFICKDYACEKKETADATEIEAVQADISDVDDKIDGLLERIDGLQEKLDAADASDADKEDIQADIDALDDIITQLESYNETLAGYSEGLDNAETAEDVQGVKTAFAAAHEEIDAYLEEQSAALDDIEAAIGDLTPAEKPDLVIEDFDLDSVDGNDGTFTITIKNDDEVNISEDENFTIRLTSFEDDGETDVDDTKVTFSDGLEADEEDEVGLEIQMAYDIEQYFEDNDDEDSLVLLFLVALDVYDDINESDETNNEEYFNITFDREDWVTNAAPTASISTSATTVLVNDIITFDGTGSADSDGSISSYSWDFGDTYSSTSSAPTYSYSTAGTYTVTLTVTDDDSATDTETVTITVS